MPELWKHQLEAIERAKDRDEFALFFEMGAGKTATAINIVREKYLQKGSMLRTLVLCPVIVIENWKREFQRFGNVPQEHIVLLKGSKHERLAELERRCWHEDFGALPKIVIVNFEGLLMESVFQKLSSWRAEVLIVDESQKCKDPRSKRTKLATQLADNSLFRYILTGTPILNSPLDLFSQFRLLDGGKTFGGNFFAFRAKYFQDKNAHMPKARYFPKWEIKPRALERLNEEIKNLSARVTKEECMDLPPLVKQTIYVELSKEQKRLYEEMKKEFITFIKGKACVAELAITKALRLQQILSGFLTVREEADETSTIELQDNPRADALKELLEEITSHSKVLIWAVFKKNYETIRKICKELELEYVEVHGEISANKKQENVDRFNSDPQCKVFLGHPGSGGIGINLVSASYSIFYSRSFSLEQDLQAEARNYRGGSEIHEKITRIDLVAKDTIDELVLKRLASKLEIGEKVLREMAEEL